jgi:hypothetical protein
MEEKTVAVPAVVAIAPDVVAPLDDEAAAPERAQPFREDKSRKARPDDEIVVALAHPLVA